MAKRTDLQREVDNALTKHLQAHQDIRGWMIGAMQQIGHYLNSQDRENAFFYVKGSSALALLFEDNQVQHNIQQSDWDTQVVINPFLEPVAWYHGFRKLTDVLRKILLVAQADFSKVDGQFLLNVGNSAMHEIGMQKLAGIQSPIVPVKHQPCNDFILASSLLHPLQYLDNAQGVLKAYPDDQWADHLEEFYPFAATSFDPKLDDPKAAIQMNFTIDKFYLFRLMVNFQCTAPVGKPDAEYKFHAELIDISVPRRDTVEALQQWIHSRPRIIGSNNGIPMPNHFYQLDEQILMVRENVAGTSSSKDKIKKRLSRGVLIASSMAQWQGVQELKIKLAGSDQSLFPECAALVLGNDWVRTVIALTLDQFTGAYDLAVDPGLRRSISRLFATQCAALQATTPDDLLFTLMQVVQQISAVVEKHLQVRSDLVVKQNWKTMREFILAIYTWTMIDAQKQFGQHGLLEDKHPVRFAVAGDLAAAVHLSQAGRHDVRCPVQRILLKIYVDKALSVSGLEQRIKEAVDFFNSNSQTMRLMPVPIDLRPTTLFLFYPEKISFEGEDPYEFLVLTIEPVVCESSQLPSLSMIDGVPFLSPRSLLKEYDNELAHLEEFGVVTRKKAISDALKKIVSQFW
jgi:hypothetical protein